MSDLSDPKRTETDLLGSREVPADAYWGVHTLRAIENFPLSGRRIHPALAEAFGSVKLACVQTNRTLGVWSDETKAEALEQACRELEQGLLTGHVVVDALQGGAGTSTNMNVNEVIANRALEILGRAKGSYHEISPLDDVNLHQSTNDTYPTALKLAAIRLLRLLEQAVIELQEAFQAKEREFSDVVKVGRTQLQDAVLTTLGREMSAYAEALSRDRWRIYKCEERLRVINLGGTAIGTGLGAPREFIFRSTEALRALTGVGFARAENLVDNTQNADVFVEVSGILKALAATLIKTANDLRLLSSGPQAGFGEISLPARQAGSSIMPGKVNPVIPEAVTQAALLVMANDQMIASAAAMGLLELNHTLPLIADALLQSLSVLRNACEIFSRHCVTGITANRAHCARSVEASTASATALIPSLGYEAVCRLLQVAAEKHLSVREAAQLEHGISTEEFEALIAPEAVTRLGSAAHAGKAGSKRGGEEIP